MTHAKAALPSLTLCELADPNIPGLESFSPFCLKAHRALKGAGLPYFRKHSSIPAAHKKYNPTGQVPVLLIGEEAVHDSTEILRRIQVLVPGAFGDESDRRLQAEAWLWEELADTSLSGFVVAARWADERNWPMSREAFFGKMPAPLRAVIPAAIRLTIIRRLRARDVWLSGAAPCWARFQQVLDDLEARAPKEGFWLGPALTVADLGIFGQLHGLRNEVTRWQGDQIQRRACLSSYLDRVGARTSSAAPSEAAQAA